MSSSVLFQLITLPVELNASKRAKEELLNLNLINKVESEATENVLTAASALHTWRAISNYLRSIKTYIYI